MNVGSQVGDGGPLALCLRTGPSTRTSVTSSIPLTERQWSGAASAAWSGSTTRSRSSPAPPDPGVNFQGKGGFNPQRLVGAAATAGARHWGGHAEGFNPQRLVGAAATGEQGRVGVEAVVSILSGSSEPLQPWPRSWPPPTSSPSFNPQRLVGAAATFAPAASDFSVVFQSSAARRSRCNSPPAHTSARPRTFQSSAARRSRCNGHLLHPLKTLPPVSILSGSSEPLQLQSLRHLLGSAFPVSILSGSSEPLQPADQLAEVVSRLVSILSGSSEPLQPALPCRGGPRREVSILSGSSEPLQRGRLRSGRSDPVSILSGSSEPLQRQEEQANRPERGFQSSAARRSRCNKMSGSLPQPQLPFQSSAARRSRCNLTGSPPAARRPPVSILSGSSEPLQPPATAACRLRISFNPQRLVGAAATWGGCAGKALTGRFQSSAARRSRCSSDASRQTRMAASCFNPQRLVGAAATRSRGR